MCHRSGGAVWEAFVLPGGDIIVDSGERATYDSGLGVTRYRCAGKCGQALYAEWGVGTDQHMAALSASFFVGGDAANEVGPICGRTCTHCAPYLGCYLCDSFRSTGPPRACTCSTTGVILTSRMASPSSRAPPSPVRSQWMTMATSSSRSRGDAGAF